MKFLSWICAKVLLYSMPPFGVGASRKSSHLHSDRLSYSFVGRPLGILFSVFKFFQVDGDEEDLLRFVAADDDDDGFREGLQ